jgi:hypothetical protein
MSGLLRRLTRRRPATADESVPPTATSSESAAAPPETPAEAGGQSLVPAEAGGSAATPADDPQPAATEAGGPQPDVGGRQPEAGGPQPDVGDPQLKAGGPQPASTEAGLQPTPTEQPTVVLPATTEQPGPPAQPLPAWTIAAGRPTAFAVQPAPARDLPAGVDPGELATAPPASARRGKLRRRLRYLRHVRGLLLRDLGGFTYEIHRTAAGAVEEPQRRLTAAKAERISALDAEVLALESRLGEPHAETLLREPGIGGTCHECGELHASDAHFCSRCGAPLDEQARAKRAAEQPTTGSHAVVEPQPASVLWAGGPRPAPAAEENEDAPEPPSEVTSQWLAGDRPTTFSRAPQPDEPAATAAKPDYLAGKTDEPKPDEPAAKTDEPTPDEPARITGETTPDQQAEAAPPQPATAAARAKPKRVSKPRKPAKRSPAKPRATEAETPQPAEPEAPQPQATEPEAPQPQATEPETEPPEPEAPEATSDEAQQERRDFGANGRRDEEIPPPTTSGDPLASRRERRS